MSKMENALKLLALSIKQHEKDPANDVITAGLIKSFEISFEYVWKALKQAGNDAGNEIYNPRDAIKSAA